MTRPEAPNPRVLEVLRASSVFGVLEECVLQDLAKYLELSTVPGGSRILHEGDAADSMLIVVSGCLRVSRRDSDGQLLLYNEIAPGECVGETGMILHQARTADVTALRDSTLGILRRAGFEALLALHPLPLNRVFSQAIFNQLRHIPQLLQRQRAESFVVVALQAGAAAGAMTADLCRALAARGRVCHLRPEARRSDVGASADLQAGIDHLEALEKEFDFIVFETDWQQREAMRRAFRQADQVIFVAAAGSACSLQPIERQLAGEPGFDMKRQHLVLVHAANARQAEPCVAWKEGRNVERIYPVRTGNAEDYGRLSRFLTGSAVGLVLGGGGARGFAHLGLLRAFTEADVPIDLVGGNSMGALIGAQYVGGVPLEEICRRTQLFALGGEHPTLPVISLLSGKRMARDLQLMFGDICIDQLWRPFFAAACNLTQACTTVQESGLLWRAVLASNSPAGIMPPVPHAGDLLVDGAILDNVPVGAMRARLGTPLEQRHGNGIIIAVDVDVQEDLAVGPEVMRLSAWKRAKGFFSRQEQELPGIGDILYRAGHIGGLHQRGRTMELADIYLEPPVGVFPLMGYRRASEIVEAGYHYAMQEIGRWEHLKRPQR